MSNDQTPATGEQSPSGATPTPAVPNPPAANGATPGAAPVSADTAAQIADLSTQLASANARIRELNAESKKHRLAAEGAASITDAERQELEAYRAYGKPDELKSRLDNETTLSSEKATREKQDGLRKIAEGLGLKGNSLFLRLADGLEFESREQDGKTVYTVKGEDGKAQSFADFAQSSEEWRDALPALQASGSNGATGAPRPPAPIMGAPGGPALPVEPRRPPGYSL